MSEQNGKNGFFSKVKRGVVRTKRRAEDSFEQSRVRTRIKEVEKGIRKQYAQIGEAVYRHAGDTIDKSTFAAEIAGIEQGYEEQQKLYFQLSEIGAWADEEESAEEKQQEIEALATEAMQKQLEEAASDYSEVLQDAQKEIKKEQKEGRDNH